MRLAQPWNDRVMAIERALDAAAQEEIRGARFKVSQCLDELLDAVASAWNRP